MSAQPYGGPILAPLVAKSLQELLGSRVPTRQTYSRIALRADVNNSSIVWVGEADVTPTTNQHGYMLQGEAITIQIDAAMVLEKVFLVGNGSDKVYISGVCY